MTTLREKRQDAVRRVVRDKAIHTQEELVAELQALGFACTQATASRDISELGLKKLSNGLYALAEDLYLRHVVREYVRKVESVENQVVVITSAGAAAVLGMAIDGAELGDVVGTVADNNTVLVICRGAEGAQMTAGLLERLRLSAG